MENPCMHLSFVRDLLDGAHSTFIGRRVNEFLFFDRSSPFYFLNFIVIFRYLIKNDYIMFISSVFWLGFYVSRPSGPIFHSYPLSILTPLFLPSSSVSLFYFILTVPMQECLGNRSCMSSAFPVAILNGSCFFPTVQLQIQNIYSARKSRNKH